MLLTNYESSDNITNKYIDFFKLKKFKMKRIGIITLLSVGLLCFLFWVSTIFSLFSSLFGYIFLNKESTDDFLEFAISFIMAHKFVAVVSFLLALSVVKMDTYLSFLIKKTNE